MSENLDKLFDVDTDSPKITIIEENPQELETTSPNAVLMAKDEDQLLLSDRVKLDLDVDNVRVIQYDLIEKGKESLDSLIQFAQDSESPRAWEVVATLLKTTSEIANSLGELTMKKIKVTSDATAKMKANRNETNVTNNTVFVGDTATLQKMLQEKQDEEV